MPKSKKKIAVILFNLGGPDSLDSVKPFLYNLFNDKYIIRLPKFFRQILAWIISTLRRKKAENIYAQMGGGSPILAETIGQKSQLEKALKNSKNATYSVHIAMRHWHPFAEQTLQEVDITNPDEIILLPLYPQFSTTTTKSSFEQFKDYWPKISNKKPVFKFICCYPVQDDFIKSHQELLLKSIKKVTDGNDLIILFSAHGLPEKIINEGDPYQWQIEQTTEAIMAHLEIKRYQHQICYQSKVGPMKWLGPNTEHLIEYWAKKNRSIIVVPIAFVSEHSETLVELDIEYREIANKYNARYIRVPTLSIEKNYINSLKNMVDYFSNFDQDVTYSSSGNIICPKELCRCAARK